MDACTNHPELDAIESCEVCRQPLCGLCLWYTADGHRLCEQHARERELAGEVVLSPETYQEALPNSLRPRQVNHAVGEVDDKGIYKGNNYDLTALIAAIIALVTLGSCFGGFYCLPVVGMIIGLIAFMNADQAVDRQRTRNLSLIGVAVMGVFIFACLALVFLYVAAVGLAVVAGP